MAEPFLRPGGPSVVAESLDGETLIVNLDSGAYYSTRGVGDAAWSLLAAGHRRDAVPAIIAARCGLAQEDVSGPLASFIDELVAEGLLVPVAEGPPSPMETPDGPLTFETPVLEKFTDMQELLVLDPVHEVEEAGWPHARPDLVARQTDG